MEVPAISRWHAPETIKITFDASADVRTFLVDEGFHRTFSLETIDPRPSETVVVDGRTGYRFPADPRAKLAVMLRLQTQRPWLRKYHIGIGTEVVNQSVFVFP
ncbi:protein-L-isoaspartate(D-aspartate) O-methyltransferase [Rhizobium sp. BK661]|nr:protein-L-isoaspartate(D-aspartate) O-methyltransferase [Rhizobium sp. BK661]